MIELKTITIDQFVLASQKANDPYDDNEYATFHLSESASCLALSFFGINFLEDTNTITLERPITEADITIIDDYLAIVEDELDTHLNDQAIAYDKWTIDHRGGDDGTFDYAGSYMLGILDTLQHVEW